jgi:hypothetical protein
MRSARVLVDVDGLVTWPFGSIQSRGPTEWRTEPNRHIARNDWCSPATDPCQALLLKLFGCERLLLWLTTVCSSVMGGAVRK